MLAAGLDSNDIWFALGEPWIRAGQPGEYQAIDPPACIAQRVARWTGAGSQEIEGTFWMPPTRRDSGSRRPAVPAVPRTGAVPPPHKPYD
jgi:hypothetical protein